MYVVLHYRGSCIRNILNSEYYIRCIIQSSQLIIVTVVATRLLPQTGTSVVSPRKQSHCQYKYNIYESKITVVDYSLQQR